MTYLFFRKLATSSIKESDYFEACLKYWQEPYIVAYESEFKTTDGEVPKNIPIDAFEIDEYISVETSATK